MDWEDAKEDAAPVCGRWDGMGRATPTDEIPCLVITSSDRQEVCLGARKEEEAGVVVWPTGAGREWNGMAGAPFIRDTRAPPAQKPGPVQRDPSTLT